MSWPGIDPMLDVSWTTPAVGQHQPDCEMVLYLIFKYEQNLNTVCVSFCYCSVVLILVEGY